MAELIASGRIADVILGFMLLEAFALWGWSRFRGGLPLADIAGQLAAGAFLVLAVRSALVDAPWPWTAAFLIASLPAHFVDLARRWRAHAGLRTASD